MKIIFLDVDGVLNNRYTEETLLGYVFISDEKIILLKELIDATKAEIVLTSTWRRGWFYKDHCSSYNGEEVWLFEALQAKLQEYDIELMDYTEEYGHRGYEISEWLKNHNDDTIESYIVIDDMDGAELRAHSAHFIQTDFSEGLTEYHIEEAIKLLNEKENL